MAYYYLEEMEKDILDYMKYDGKRYIDSDILADRDTLEEYLYDKLWTNDTVTGNGSGSYTFNSYKAKEYVMDNIDTCREMISEFCIDAETVAEKFLNEEWEYFDVSIRCYLLGQAIGEALDELEEEGFFEQEEESGILETVTDIIDTVSGAIQTGNMETATA